MAKSWRRTTFPRCTNLLSLAFKVNVDGTIKKRLVIDLSRWINKFVIPDSFCMSRFQDALAQSTASDFQSVFDVSKAYHHIRLHPDSYELVGFCVEDEAAKEHFYFYVVVVFGLGPVGQTLGRVMRPVLKFLTDAGVRNLMYDNKGLIVTALKEKADRDYATTILTFEKAGFVISREKSDFFGSSSQRKEYLGFTIDTATLTVEVPKPNLDRIRKLLKTFWMSPRHKVREVASILGKLISLEPALGRSIMVCTSFLTIEVVAATEVSEIAKRRHNPW
jgi:hypothetical protein